MLNQLNHRCSVINNTGSDVSLSTELLESYFDNPPNTSMKKDEFINNIMAPAGPIEIVFKYLQKIGKVNETKVSGVMISATIATKSHSPSFVN